MGSILVASCFGGGGWLQPRAVLPAAEMIKIKGIGGGGDHLNVMSCSYAQLGVLPTSTRPNIAFVYLITKLLEKT